MNEWAIVELGKVSFDHRSLMNTVVKREGNRPIMMIVPRYHKYQFNSVNKCLDVEH